MDNRLCASEFTSDKKLFTEEWKLIEDSISILSPTQLSFVVPIAWRYNEAVFWKMWFYSKKKKNEGLFPTNLFDNSDQLKRFVSVVFYDTHALEAIAKQGFFNHLSVWPHFARKETYPLIRKYAQIHPEWNPLKEYMMGEDRCYNSQKQTQLLLKEVFNALVKKPFTQFLAEHELPRKEQKSKDEQEVYWKVVAKEIKHFSELVQTLPDPPEVQVMNAIAQRDAHVQN